MAKGAYIGVGGVARKIKKGYIGGTGTGYQCPNCGSTDVTYGTSIAACNHCNYAGMPDEFSTVTVQNIARKIKKAYIGIGGVARPCWSGGELTYYGTITDLNGYTYIPAGASTTDYAIFMGAANGASPSHTLSAYNASLTRTDKSSYSSSYWTLGAQNPSYALFLNQGNPWNSQQLSAVNNSLTRTIAMVLDGHQRASASFGDYGVFSGGYQEYETDDGSDYNYLRNCDFVNSSLTKTSVIFTNTGVFNLASASITSRLFIGGGRESKSYYNCDTQVFSFDSSLTRTALTRLSEMKEMLSAVAVNDEYVLFVGGNSHDMSSASEFSNMVEVYNASGTKTIGTSLSVGRYNAATVSLGEYGIVAGGVKSNATPTRSATVDSYDASLTRTIQLDLSSARSSAGTATVGNFALIAGGEPDLGASKSVDAYTIA